MTKMVKTIHYCSQCDYKSNRRWDHDRHVSRIHVDIANLSTGEDTPKAETVGQYSIKPTSHYESTSPEIYPLTTITIII